MVTWELISFGELGPLRFGTGRDDVRRLLGLPSKEFTKAPSSRSATDEYAAFGVHLHYDREERLEFIEAFPPCRVIFRMKTLMDREVEDVEQSLQKIRPRQRISGSSRFFDDGAFALIIEEMRITGVSLFAEDYFAQR